MIELIKVSKTYTGQTVPAVTNLTLTIKEGETCVLVGPSGCGKSTILRMINRMIEPTSGTILINKENIKEKDADKLRLRIGYVIQQIGLLPHRTVAENIAIVPRLCGWSKEEINRRIDEMLELVGLDPKETRTKFPAQLSGGQMQRVGVARAMAADPPIMLMDEPFGAVDPIVRKHLQDEFLRLQKEMKKTVCFVTHDINEAIKMGDKIAIFNTGRLVQHGTPQEILSKPINNFVSDFIGHDRIIKKLTLFQVFDVASKKLSVIREDEIANIKSKMQAEETPVCFLVNRSGTPCGLISLEDLQKANSINPEKLKETALDKKGAFIDGNRALTDALSQMLEWDTRYLGVMNGNKLCGIISLADIKKYASEEKGEE